MVVWRSDGGLMVQVCEWKSRWNRSDLEAPSATAVEVHPAQNVSHPAGVGAAEGFQL